MIQGSWEGLLLNKCAAQKRKGCLEEKSSIFRVVKEVLVFELGDWGSNLFPINSIEIDLEGFLFAFVLFLQMIEL